MNILEGNNNKLINFSVSVPEWENNDNNSNQDSRATPISGISLGTSSTFNMIADVNNGSNSYSTIINNETVSFINSMWQTTTPHYWSGVTNKTVNFYAYYPSNISTIFHTVGSVPTLSYTVPTESSNQIDIITATGNNVSGNTNSSTPLTFNHIFAAVKFAVGNNGLPSGTIKSITISGIKNTGTYTFGSGWTPSSTTSSFTVSPSTAITGSAGVNITSDAYTLMMIPQVFSNATVSLIYNNGTTFSTTISGTWNAGNSYTYNLSKTVVSNFAYTGASQTFTVQYAGTYRIQCWGAQGRCQGAYTSGDIYLNKGTNLYVYVGSAGVQSSTSLSSPTVFNGGGGYTSGCLDYNNSTGGGATDIRLVNGSWDDFSSLKSRIIVAAGGGGNIAPMTKPGYGGALTSADADGAYPQSTFPSDYGTVSGVTQTSGYSFGIGQTGNSGANLSRSGGGGGYYGGYAYHCAASGGSSFISGYPGCNAISASSTSTNIIPTGSPNHSSGYIFINSSMIAGDSSMPSPSGSAEIGHLGAGYARITFISAN
ncbi:fimbrillin family protein [Prevotella herbatica]|uniref:receptor protein-tyrosine kinase n=2 Tax=Prevotella herbatica TaxID=2801997 RepID=A0ABM7NZD1_9BACT|nr:fimbrillin family protein [Prevotella herbatica]